MHPTQDYCPVWQQLDQTADIRCVMLAKQECVPLSEVEVINKYTAISLQKKIISVVQKLTITYKVIMKMACI